MKPKRFTEYGFRSANGPQEHDRPFAFGVAALLVRRFSSPIVLITSLSVFVFEHHGQARLNALHAADAMAGPMLREWLDG